MNDVEEIKSRLNIVDVIGGYVKLTQAGINYKALCPFHHEKTPSFVVNEERQVFHCFGCGKGGDIFTFIQEIDGVDFREALKLLADRAGVQLKGYDGQKSQEKSQSRNILKEAVSIFQENLESSAGKQAGKYLKERGVSVAMMEKFALGFALDGWQGLFDKLIRLKFKPEEIKKAGLAVESEKRPGSFYDRFRNRIMFPIYSSFGEPLGFSARLLPGDDSEMGKYINTPQTEVYDKSQALYGINLAKNAIKQKDFCILLEGNLDVVMSHIAEVENVVATCGTAVTKDQLKIIQRYSNNIAFAFDVDEAGIKASKKGIDLALSVGANVKAIDLGIAGKGNKDVADIVQKSPKKWREISQKAKPAMEYYFDIILKGYDKSDVDQRKEITDELLEKIALFPSKIDQAYYLEKLAEVSATKLEVLYDIFNGKLAALETQQNKETYRNDFRDEKIENNQERKQETNGANSNKIIKLLNRITALIIFYPKIIKNGKTSQLKIVLKNLQKSDTKEIIDVILECNTQFPTPDRYLDLIKEERLKTKVAQLITIAENSFNAYSEDKLSGEFSPEENFDFCLEKVKEILRKEKLEDLTVKIKMAEKVNDKERLTELIKTYNLLLRKK